MQNISSKFPGLSIIFSSFLLFQIQPLIVKTILPTFGGGSSVWIVALLFFQFFLFFGYLYAHLTKKLGNKEYLVHIILFSLTVLISLISKPWSMPATTNTYPEISILLALILKIGLPYLILASTSPLVQRFVSKETFPYKYYSISNIASLLSLLSFPVLEIFMTLNQIWTLWFVLFLIYIALIIKTNLIFKNKNQVFQDEILETENKPLSKWLYLKWIALSAIGVVLLSSITTILTEDVASSPILWIIPLSIYLLSFIFSFQSDFWHRPKIYSITSIVSGMLFLTFVIFNKTSINLSLQVLLSSLFSFFAFMLVHSKLYRTKPQTNKLTNFYLSLAFGGGVGGFLTSIISPIIFNDYYEIYLVFFIIMVLSARIVFRKKDSKGVTFIPFYSFIISLILIFGIYITDRMSSYIKTYRNFYGTLKVQESNINKLKTLTLTHGNTNHGFEVIGNSTSTTSYYGENSGVGRLMKKLSLNPEKELKVAVIGLGTGTMANYGDLNDQYYFYEINPEVINIAKMHFSFLKQSKAKIETILGDARISLKESPEIFDVIVLDAFSSDAIPAHLLTKEAVSLYLDKLNYDGVIAIHISNRHLDLSPIVGSLAKHYSLETLMVSTFPKSLKQYEVNSHWILVTRDIKNFASIDVTNSNANTNLKRGPLWTDQKYSILQVLK